MAHPAEAVTPPDISGLVDALRVAVRRVSVEALSGEEATELLKSFSEGERLCAAGRTITSRAVERSGVWREQGERTAAHWVAAATGIAVGQVVGSLETARRLEDFPATAQAFAEGRLTEAKVREVAAAAEVSPSSESELLEAARTQSVAALKETCRRVRFEATDQDQAYVRIHETRYLRHWTETDGAFRLDARLTPDDGARVLSAIQPDRERIFAEAWKGGRRESSEAYAADALVALATRRRSGPSHAVQVRVDHAALLRGHALRGEICEVPGVGSIPVSVARTLTADSVLNVVVTKGSDVTAVAHGGRTIPARVRTALEARDPTCVVPGCDGRVNLEIDHRIPFAEGGPSSLDNLVRMCRWHHFLKTHRGYRLGGSARAWTWSGPDPPLGKR